MISATKLREILDYDPASGVLTWRIAVNRRIKAGAVAGYLHTASGYWLVGIDGDLCRAHRLAWLWMTGEWPAAQIDHIDGDRANNRWGNLRSVTNAVNARNQRAGHKDGATGLLGVSAHGGKYQAKITVDGAQKHLGLFDTPEEASAAYKAAKLKFHGPK